MGNLADLLKDVAGYNGQAVSIAADAIGVIADIGGVAGVASELIGLFSTQSDDIGSALDDIETSLKDNFSELRAADRASNLLARWATFDPALSQAETAVAQIPDAVASVPAVTKEYVLQQIGYCLNAVIQFDQDDKWLTNFTDELYYGQELTDDTWTGEIAPSPDNDGLVFSDRYILPDFLYALFAFLAVAAALEPGYSATYANSLKEFQRRLQTTLTTSASGLVTIRRPTPEEVGIASKAKYVWTGESTWMSPFGIDTNFYSLEATQQELDDAVYHEYGVVHTYSGYSNISNYPFFALPRPEPPEQWWTELNARLDLATRRNWKRAYVDLGLSKAWEAVNHLASLTGEGSIKGPNPGTTWTVREIAGLLGSAFANSPAPTGYISARYVVVQLEAAAGQPSEKPGSFRTALAAALNSATITPRPAGPYAPVSTY